jgi:uncharacterized protein (TIGR00645 family)
LPRLIFATRWLSLPLWLGLILAQGVYMAQFWVVLAHLIEVAFGKQTARITRVKRTGHQTDTILGPNGQVLGQEPITALTEPVLLRVVLALDLKLIDGVMISYRLTRVTVGGYETFMPRLRREGRPDQPQWLNQVNASVLKVKLATAIIGISSIHLLKTFINAANDTDKVLTWPPLIRIRFLVSALATAMADRIMHPAGRNPH